MYPCLWLRGLLPQQLVPCASAPVATFPTFVSGPQCPSGSWPAGYYGTDASGGVFSSISQLRRVGVGIASLFVSHSHGTEEVEYAFGAWSALVGEVQTIPRGELYALVVLVRNVEHSAWLHVFSDSKVNIDLYHKGKSICVASPNGDLFEELFGLISSKHLQFVLEFVPSHLHDKPNKHLVQTCWSCPLAVIANTCADTIAEHAAERVCVPPSSSTPILHAIKLVTCIQLRLHCIMCNHTKRERTPIEQAPKVIDHSLAEVASMSDHLAYFSHLRISCAKCCSSVSSLVPALAKDWLRAPCHAIHPPVAKPHKLPLYSCILIGRQVTHKSHSLYLYRGLLYCNKCGSRGEMMIKKLALPCEKPTVSGLGILKRINDAKLPVGLTSWPDSRRPPLHVYPATNAG